MAERRVYGLFPKGGSFSPRTEDADGIEYLVSAANIRQAYAVAHNEAWVTPGHQYPTGIIAIWYKGDGYRLWCGCVTRDVGVSHGAGVTRIRAALREHICTDSVCIDCIEPGILNFKGLCSGCWMARHGR